MPISLATKQCKVQSTYGLFFSRLVKNDTEFSVLEFVVSECQGAVHPMIMEQIVRGDTCSPGPPETPNPVTPQVPKRKRGRPKGSRNRNKTEVELSDTLKQIQT